MARKKITTGPPNASSVAFLDDDEELVKQTTTTEKIGRQKRQAASEPPDEPQTVDGLLIDDDDMDEVNPPQFSDMSLAALIYGSEDESPVESQFCTVSVRREPDSLNDHFLNPSASRQWLLPLRNISLAEEKADIEEQVRTLYGGGHYLFQLQFGGRIASSWKTTLADDPAAITAAKNEKLAAANPQPQAMAAPVTPANPLDTFLENAAKMRQLKAELFGEREASLEAQIAELKAEVDKARVNPGEPKSEKLLLLEAASAAGNSKFADRIIDSVFPADEEAAGRRHWFADTLAVALENKDTIVGLLGSVLGVPAPQPTQTNIADMMRGPAPAEIPPAASRFQRRMPVDGPVGEPPIIEPPPPVIGVPMTPERSNELSEFADDIKDAEIVDEKPLQKPARSKGVKKSEGGDAATATAD